MMRKLCPACGMVSVAVLVCAVASLAGPFDQGSRDFAFGFCVDGYQHETRMVEPTSLALDSRAGLIYVADAKADGVMVLTLQGMAKEPALGGKLKSPFAVAVDKDGSLYVAESEGGPIKVVNSKGEVTELEVPVSDGEDPARPGRMAFDRDGNLYVVDRTSQRIRVLDKERKSKLDIGERGDKRGQFSALQDVAVDRQGRIYALDSGGTPIQVFDRKGKYLYRIGFRGNGEEDVSSAAGLFVDQNDQIWVVDRGQHSLKVFDRTGTFLRRFGIYGTQQGSLFQPVHAVMDNFGRVYVLEAGARRLQAFSLSRPFERLTPSGL